MVRFDSEEEFVAAMTGFMSWRSCLRVEVTVLKSVPSSAAVSADTSAETAQPAASTVVGNQGEAETEKVAVSEATPSEMTEPTPSESGSMMSFVSDVTRSTISGATAKIPAGPVAPRPEPAPAAATSTAGDVPATISVEPEVPPPAAPSPAGSSASAAQFAASGDTSATTPTAQAKAFLTQVLPSLADVLARSMYAAQMMPNAMAPPTSQSSRNAEDIFGSTAAGLAAAAATAAATAASMASSVSSVAENVQAPVDHAPANTSGAVPAAPAQPPVVPAGNAPAATPVSASATPHEANSPVVHTGIVCDVCEVCPIVGTRYKCAVRSDFDLCEACEAVTGADSPFPFLKIRTPAQVPSAIVCLLRPDQPASIEEASTGKNHRGNNASGSRSYAPGQPWRARRSPQRGGWGEGRRNCQRWMKDMARRQQQQELLAGGRGSVVPPGVEVVRCAPPPWCGPRMQRRKQDDTAPPTAVGQKSAEEPVKKSEAERDGVEPPTPPASVASSEHGSTIVATAVSDPANAGVAQAEVAPEEVVEADTVEKPANDPFSFSAATEAEAEASQPPNYHDLLATSMRSLASSMSSSHPIAAAPQEKSRGHAGSGEASKPQGKPMARFVTDVSVADGSPLPPNTRFVKTWCMRNDGAVIFPPGCKLMPVGGDLMSGPEDGVPVESRAPGEEFHVSDLRACRFSLVPEIVA